MKFTNPKKQKRDQKKRAKRKRKAAMRIQTKHHNSPDTIRPELKEDIRWFARNPQENQLARSPSERERREWGGDVIEVMVFRTEDGGYATVPLHGVKVS